MITKYKPEIRKGYFALKEFAVKQTVNEMKVCTDSLLFGALFNFSNHFEREFSVLEIGTGTGLLALQCAQLNKKATIHAIEIDEASALEAAFNFRESVFSNQLTISQGDAIHFPFDRQYDVVVCNPPFFLNALPSPKEAVNRVRHISSLNFQTLLQLVERVLMNGNSSIFALLMAKEEMDSFLLLCKESTLKPFKALKFQHSSNSRWMRSVVFFSRSSPLSSYTWETLVIKEDDSDSYTAEAKSVLGPFLLHL